MDRSRERVVGVVNSTPLIALSIVGHLNLLPALLDDVVIPASVHEEVVGEGIVGHYYRRELVCSRSGG